MLTVSQIQVVGFPEREAFENSILCPPTSSMVVGYDFFGKKTKNKKNHIPRSALKWGGIGLNLQKLHVLENQPIQSLKLY